MTDRPPPHESRDAHVVPILVAGAVLALLVAGAMLLLRPLPHPEPDVTVDEQAPVHHWVDTRRLLDERRALAERRLHEWTWVDEERTVATIPIDEAMRLMAAEHAP